MSMNSTLNLKVIGTVCILSIKRSKDEKHSRSISSLSSDSSSSAIRAF